MNQRQPSVEGRPRSVRKTDSSSFQHGEGGSGAKVGSTHSAPSLCWPCCTYQPREHFKNISLGLCNLEKVQIFSFKEPVSS